MKQSQNLMNREALSDALMHEKKNIATAKEYCYRALEILQKELKTPNEPLSDSRKRSVRDQMKDCLKTAGIDQNEQVSIWEEIYGPLIEKKDVDNLVLWAPGWRPMRFDPHKPPGPIKRYYQLLEKIAVVLETRKGETQVRNAPSNIRDCQAKISRLFPRLDLAQEPASLPVTILVAKEDWPQKRGTNFSMVELEENMHWTAFVCASSSSVDHRWPYIVRLAGIDIAHKQLFALWQAEFTFPGHPGRLSGMTISESATYLSVGGVGLVTFPGRLTRGREFLHNPKVLTEKEGLPSTLITGVVKIADKLWIAYGGRGQESGLGIYDPKNGHWETVLCSTLKGEPPFNSGQPYVLYELTLAQPDKLFFVACDPEYSKPTRPSWWEGLWKFNTRTQELKHFGLGGISAPGGGHIVDSGARWWFKTHYWLTQFDPESEKTKLILGEPGWLIWNSYKKIPRLKFQSEPFIPKSSQKKLTFGPIDSGYLDLSTCAVQDNKLWARLGRSQIIIIHKGKGFEEAEIIDNNILNGDKVLRFFSTPYGLIAVGEGTVGLIETKNHEK